MIEVILVDENDLEIGRMEKMRAHELGKLHRAFSVFLLDEKGRVLLQKRALSKYHSPGLWTNTCCSHPQPDEDIITSARRRLMEEMGITTELTEIFTFIYYKKFENGLIEYEYDHVLLGSFSGEPEPNPEEVEDWDWQPLDFLVRDYLDYPEKYTYWFKLAIQKVYHKIKPPTKI